MSATAKDYKLAAEWVRELRERGVASHEAAQTAEQGFAYLFSATNPAFHGGKFHDACQPRDPAKAARNYRVRHS